jgi:hypothetical protein
MAKNTPPVIVLQSVERLHSRAENLLTAFALKLIDPYIYIVSIENKMKKTR